MKTIQATRNETVARSGDLAERKVDRDGIWLILAPGFHDAMNPESHVMLVQTEAEAAAALEDIELCNCRRCWPMGGK